MALEEDNRFTCAPALIRPERAGDAAAVRRVLAAAFGQDDEADLVERLRPIARAFVAEIEGEVAGHVMTSPMRGPRAAGLAPLAVAAPFRRRGVGAALVERAIAAAREDGMAGVFVLGDPAYYGRFGFAAETAAPFACRYAGPHLMALELEPGALAAGGPLDYAAPFDG